MQARILLRAFVHLKISYDLVGEEGWWDLGMLLELNRVSNGEGGTNIEIPV